MYNKKHNPLPNNQPPSNQMSSFANSWLLAFADVQAAAMDVGADMTIQLDADDSVTLLGVQVADLNANDFVI